MTVGAEQRKLHYDLKNVGLRAQATASGLVQLCKELQNAGILDEAAVTRIKSAIADEIALTAPRAILREEFRRDVCNRLNSIFAGDRKLGEADGFALETQGSQLAD